jgi:amino acid transporter
MREQGTTRSLGFFMSTALVVGNLIGSGVFLLPASLTSNGRISIVGWLFNDVGALMLALVFDSLDETPLRGVVRSDHPSSRGIICRVSKI